MDKYPIRLVGEPYVPRELDLDMEPPEWHTPWFEADALDADGHHHRVYWPIPNKTNEWLVGHLLTVDDPDFGDVCERLAMHHDDGGALRAASLLKRWLADGLLAADAPVSD